MSSPGNLPQGSPLEILAEVVSIAPTSNALPAVHGVVPKTQAQAAQSRLVSATV